MFKTIFITLFIVLFGLGKNECAKADGIDIRTITDSSSYRQIENELSSKRTHLGGVYDDGSNYSKLFKDRKSYTLLFSWFGVRGFDFKLINTETPFSTKVLKIKRTFQNKDDRKVSTVVYIPRPLYLAEAEVGLLEDYKNIEPPRLPVEVQEDVQVQGEFEGKFYELKDHTCSLFVKMPKSIRVQISAKCDNRKDIFELAEALSFKQLENKLLN